MASRGKTTQLDHMFVADFETCNDLDSFFKTDVKTGKDIYNQRVWLGGFKNLETMENKYFYDIDSFMECILSRGDNKNTEFGIHNLKFDGSYIVPYLVKNGYKATHFKPKTKQFSIMVDKMNNWYSITIRINTRKKVTIWDTHKLFPAPLEYLHEVYSTPTHKIHEDSEFYEGIRPKGYIPNEREMSYFDNDLQVLAETLNKHIELFGLRFKKTQASQSFYNFEQKFKGWKWRFPPLSIEEDLAIRPAYWGGIAHVQKGKENTTHKEIRVDDINSSYPDKAANFKLPYGRCVEQYGEGKEPNMSKFWVAEALVEFTLHENCLPCIPSKAIIDGVPLDSDLDKWVDDSNGIVRMTFSNIDFMTMQLSYKIKVWRWCWTMHWDWKVHKEIADFVYMNNDIKVKYSKLAKKETDPEKKAEYNTKRNRAKIDNNSFYGKFGEDVIKEGKTPYLSEDGENIIWKLDKREEQKEGKRKFLPVAMAITAWGRLQLVTVANILGKYFLYCDTDSLHFLAEGEYLLDEATKKGLFEADPEKLGAWDCEGYFTKGRYLRAKCYMEEDQEGERHATVAGLPADKHSGMFSKKRSCLNWDNFKIGCYIDSNQTNKLRTLRTQTGNKLIPVHFQIKQTDSLFGF